MHGQLNFAKGERQFSGERVLFSTIDTEELIPQAKNQTLISI